MPDEPERSRSARRAAEAALVRVVHHYGARPEFVLLGGLVPDLLCSASSYRHAGTTDVDVQVDLELACGAVNTKKLEYALRNAEFQPDSARVWRWVAAEDGTPMVVKFELLADLDDQPAGVEIQFEGCDRLGAVNLRGTGFASRDVEVREITSRVGGVIHRAEINVTGLAGFLLAKTAAAHSRRKAKDWYDIAFVLLHNDRGGPQAAVDAILIALPAGPAIFRTALDDLRANFASPAAQGPVAYASQMMLDHEGLDEATLRADAVLAVDALHVGVLGATT